ncbi:RpiB/LacA/LacB family sugar-phosphate isomerase [Candidatus Falkowbacteria bacterium]|nr:RpiB/LacA/LacB family sugar-phosphate isomerase [Candidatus Falkowbacteria bacterium]
MKIYLGADHAGFALKETMKAYLVRQGFVCKDLGNIQLDKNDDYPDFSVKVARAVAKDTSSRGALFCGSAQGACITANKVKGIRAASVRSVAEAVLAIEHDDVNVICLAGGQQVQRQFKGVGIPNDQAKKIVRAYLSGKFSSAARHHRRVNKIKAIEKRNFR